MLKYDHGTNNYTQWFFFSVRNTRAGKVRQLDFN